MGTVPARLVVARAVVVTAFSALRLVVLRRSQGFVACSQAADERYIGVCHWLFEPDIALESTDILFLIRLNERDNYTTLACSSGSARPVHIGLMVLRWIEVDH